MIRYTDYASHVTKYLSKSTLKVDKNIKPHTNLKKITQTQMLTQMKQ